MKFINLILCVFVSLYSQSLLSGKFQYEKELFELNTDSIAIKALKSNETLTFEDLRQDIENRKTHLMELFQYVQMNGIKKDTKALFAKKTDYVRKFRVDLTGDLLTPEVMILSLLKCDYVVEKDLVCYFLNCLDTFSKAPASEVQMQKFYNQTIYVVRQNLQSLWNSVFGYLKLKYPQAFKEEEGEKIIYSNFVTHFTDEEEKLYFNFLKEFRCDEIMENDSVQINRMVLYLLDENILKCPTVIYELNSILFYFNIERTLLSACASLHCDSKFFHFDKPLQTQDHEFVLAKVANKHRTGFLSTSFLTSITDKKAVDLYSKPNIQNAVVKGCLEEPTQIFKSFIEDMFPDQMKPVESPSKKKNQPKKSVKNEKKSKTQKLKKEPLKTFAQKQEIKVVEEESAENKIKNEMSEDEVFESGENKLDESDVNSEEDLEDIQIENVNIQKDKKNTQLSVVPYKTSLEWKDYAYKRFVRAQKDRTYTFENTPYSFPDMENPHNLALLEKIARREVFPNLASYRIRFHYAEESSPKKFESVEFFSSKKYFSGCHFFEEQKGFKRRNKLFNAFTDILSESQQGEYKKANKEERRTFLGKTLTPVLCETIVNGDWTLNANDAEAIMLLDLANELPNYLSQLTKNGTKKIHLHGIALGISTYYDCCWRCINLIQGWQRDLKNRIQHWSDQISKGVIAISPDFSTVALTFGEKLPNFKSFYFPDALQGPLKLERGTHPSEQHKLTCIKVLRDSKQ
ncbi:hypothetical protein [Candidatus Bealeia paramacronuclearis]